MHVMLMFSYVKQAGIVLNNFLVLGIEEHDPTRMPIMPFSRSQRTKRNLAPGLKSLTRDTFKDFGQMGEDMARRLYDLSYHDDNGI